MTTVIILIIAMMITVTPAVAPISLEQPRRMLMPCNEQNPSLSIVVIINNSWINCQPIHVVFSRLQQTSTGAEELD